MKNNKWFTLVELIIVIVILSILATIAFISFWNFTVSARDSKRLTDIKNLWTLLESTITKVWNYPKPENSTDITYSWAMVFTQWIFWPTILWKLKWEIDQAPQDPLYGNYYSYSISSTKRSYNISWIEEWWNSYSFNTFWKANATASNGKIIARVWWDYNWQIVHTQTWGMIYIFSAPSIILSDLSNTEILETTDKYVFDKEPNIASSYSWKINQVWVLNYKPLLVYSGSHLPRTPESLKTLIINVKRSFNNLDHPTELFSNDFYKALFKIDVNNSNDLYDYWAHYINSGL